MRSLQISAAVALLLAARAGTVTGQGRPQDSLTIAAAVRESRGAATAGLDTLKALARTNFRSVGFASGAEAAGATLGEPFVVFFVRLDSLRAFAGTADPTGLLSGSDQVIYPVMLGGAARSSVALTRKNGAWKPVTYGGSGLTATLVRQRSASAGAERRAESAYFMVRVPALGLDFIGTRAGTAFTLTPLVDDPRGRWKAGVVAPARDLFLQLVPDARAASDLPG